MDNILSYIKTSVGATIEDDSYDVELLMLINSEFDKIYQMGYRPSEEIYICTVESTWSEYFNGKTEAGMVKEFVYLNVKLIFDPPTTSFVLEAINNKISQLDWRIHQAGNKNTIIE